MSTGIHDFFLVVDTVQAAPLRGGLHSECALTQVFLFSVCFSQAICHRNGKVTSKPVCPPRHLRHFAEASGQPLKARASATHVPSEDTEAPFGSHLLLPHSSQLSRVEPGLAPREGVLAEEALEEKLCQNLICRQKEQVWPSSASMHTRDQRRAASQAPPWPWTSDSRGCLMVRQIPSCGRDPCPAAVWSWSGAGGP